jgi:type IV pilus assembly protein PilW
MRNNHPHHAYRVSMRGVTLIELMVGIVIALIASLVIAQVFSVSESYKRSTTGGSDALQSGGFSTYALSRLIGAGGAGFASTPSAVGCALGVFRGGTQLFGQTTSPYRIATALPAPFDAAINFRITLAPALIIAGADNDTPDNIIVMAGNHPSMGRHSWVSSQGADTVTLADNTVLGINNSRDSAGATQHDLLLAVDQDPGSARATNTTCDIAEAVDDPATTAPYAIPNPISLSTGANFSGPNRFKGTGTPSYYSKTLTVSNLGPVSKTTPPPGSGPQFVVLGVGNDGTTPNALLALNLITGYCPAVATGCATAGSWVTQSLADNIISIKAIYGVAHDTIDPNVISWEDPTGATWGAAALSASRTNLLKVRAIRLAVIARNAQPEKKADTAAAGASGFSPATFTLFGDAASTTTGSLSKTVDNPDRHYRYKIFDITIPLRNMVLMTQNP